jgi:polar amino acid transport system permease protein
MIERSSSFGVINPLAPILTAYQRRGVIPSAYLGRSFLAGVLLLIGSSIAVAATAGQSSLSIAATLLKWTPLIAHGFLINIALSVAAMAIGTVLGVLLGVSRISHAGWLRTGSWLTIQFFRNAPWLILLFYCMLLIPFEIHAGSLLLPLPDWFKAILALSLGVMANMAEIVRGAIQSVPKAQWEAAESLAFSRQRTIWRIILPQCIQRMLPPWMNLYALLLVSTPLCSIVGVSEALTLTADALVAESRQDLLVPMYSYVLLWFFMACYPIARATTALERRFSVAS